MSSEIVPSDGASDESRQHDQPSGDENAESSKADGGRERRRRKFQLPSREKVLHAQSQVPGLVAMKILSPTQANAITRATQVYLAETREASAGGTAQGFGENFQAKVRANPDLQELLEPMLSDEQIEALMRDGTDDHESET